MRVIGGEYRSRKLKSVGGTGVRPTPDRMRETLFNVISSDIVNAVFVDAYAGTGAVGIEALSRGAAWATFIETNRDAVKVIQSNLASLDLSLRSRVVLGPVKLHLAMQDAQIVFLDPPYALESEYETSLESLSRKPPHLAVAQHDRRTALKPEFGKLKRVREIRQGDNVLSFYRPTPA